MALLGVKALPISYVAHVLAVAALILVLTWTIRFRGGFAWEDTNKNLIFNLHPVLMLTGIIVIGGQAIMSYKSLPLERPTKKQIHLSLHAVAFTLGVIGIYLAFKYHNESHIPNLYSLHSWLGIGVISLYGLQWVYGFLVFFFPGGTGHVRSTVLPWHVLAGILIYILAICTATLGFLEKLTFLQSSGLARYGSESFLVNFTAIVAILYGAFVIVTTLGQVPTEDEHAYAAL